MALLNSKSPLINYQGMTNATVFVDKSLMLSKISSHIGIPSEKYICITRPRRFGKTINAQMVASYYSKVFDTHSLFNSLKISQTEDYEKHINAYHVVYIDFTEILDNLDSYDAFEKRFFKKVKLDLIKNFPNVNFDEEETISDLFYATNSSFIFVMDEWDAIFQSQILDEISKRKYLMMLKGMLKDKPYVQLAYLTGILPIAKYSSGSELNMFNEHSFLNDREYCEYFGFTENEVLSLCHTYKMDFDEICEWYNGYYDYEDRRIFNPRSVSMAITNHFCQSYWTETGPMNEIELCIQNDVGSVQNDLIRLISKEKIEIEFDDQFSAENMQLKNRDEILSAMVIYGFLSYHNGILCIPNQELMLKFNKVLLKEDVSEIYKITKMSEEMLRATWNMDFNTMAQIMETCHESEIDLMHYNNESSLTYVVSMVYLKARDYYKIVREEQSGKGYADFIFYPYRKQNPAIVLELKVDSTPEKAIQQIRDKNYIEKVKNYKEILLVGIAYSKKDKKHTCKVEKL